MMTQAQMNTARKAGKDFAYALRDLPEEEWAPLITRAVKEAMRLAEADVVAIVLERLGNEIARAGHMAGR